MHTELFQCLISTILDDDEGYRQLQLAGRSQALNGIHARAVADEPDHFLCGFPKCHADSRRQAMSEPAVAAGVKPLASIYRQISLHDAPTARRLLYDDAFGRAYFSQRLHQI